MDPDSPVGGSGFFVFRMLVNCCKCLKASDYFVFYQEFLFDPEIDLFSSLILIFYQNAEL
ncbi:MAG: hypothetical protein DWQ02_06310 [Bacteroidetes bacterium]|nr:MAG: hypothetical protein DWQ02_06310 [Bacteroidota bacterium]